MALAEFLSELDSLTRDAGAAFAAAGDAAALEAARIEFLGAKSGRLKAIQKGLGGVDKADKPAAGKRFNEVKQEIEAAQEAAAGRLSKTAGPVAGVEQFDPTVPGARVRLGRPHPVTQTIEELREIMGRLGFSVVDGPEVEDSWHNFDALNIPPAHPARDPLENFYLTVAGSGQRSAVSDQKDRLPSPASGRGAGGEGGLPQENVPGLSSPLLLRSQTSTVQIRVMEKTSPPVRIISCGRVYRPDTADATHYPMFHQIEGAVDRPPRDDGRPEEYASAIRPQCI